MEPTSDRRTEESAENISSQNTNTSNHRRHRVSIVSRVSRALRRFQRQRDDTPDGPLLRQAHSGGDEEVASERGAHQPNLESTQEVDISDSGHLQVQAETTSAGEERNPVEDDMHETIPPTDSSLEELGNLLFEVRLFSPQDTPKHHGTHELADNFPVFAVKHGENVAGASVCMICLEALDRKVMLLPCLCVGHENCLREAIRADALCPCHRLDVRQQIRDTCAAVRDSQDSNSLHFDSEAVSDEMTPEKMQSFRETTDGQRTPNVYSISAGRRGYGAGLEETTEDLNSPSFDLDAFIAELEAEVEADLEVSNPSELDPQGARSRTRANAPLVSEIDDETELDSDAELRLYLSTRSPAPETDDGTEDELEGDLRHYRFLQGSPETDEEAEDELEDELEAYLRHFPHVQGPAGYST